MNILKIFILILIVLFGILIQPLLWLIALFVPDDKSIYYHTLRSFTLHNCKCDSNWHNSFLSQMDFEELDKKNLTQFKPIGHTLRYSPKPKARILIYEYGAQKSEGGFIYECISCNKLWELSHPENAYRGYFKGINLDLESIKRYLK